MVVSKLDPDFVIQDEAALRKLFPPTHDLAIKKCLTSVDKYSRDFIARSPFLCLGTQNRSGKADVSPRGDLPGFVKVLDAQTLAIPDRPGNNRLDSLSNILENPSTGLLFLIPGFDDTLRINGQAQLVRDPWLLEGLSVDGRPPRLAILVKVETVFMHCAKAFRRSRLWDPDQFQNRKEMPSLIEIIHEQTTGEKGDSQDMTRRSEALEEDYKRTLY
ncbi:pyridoxamine 5'-phosphate oxidase family protein [Roseibium sp.]|uniref:pyridoxamine 5'-phosphate oxidase family protein n=1 Tax=Roseibium sp. TaxID=1936156 RepID=UPI003BB025E5